jgi:23S rRNA G2069 N7-methylase RlmK/C1962 C5-methylase RlmI
MAIPSFVSPSLGSPEAGDGVPGLAVDIYGSYAQVQLYSEHWKPMLGELYQTIGALGVKGAYLKKRLRGMLLRVQVACSFLFFFFIPGKRQTSTHAWGARPADDSTVVYESGLRFDVNLVNPHTTGLFLDQRINRQCARAPMASNLTSNRSR